MPRPQFTLKTLLWLMAVVAAFCAGILVGRAIQRQIDWEWEHSDDDFHLVAVPASQTSR